MGTITIIMVRRIMAPSWLWWLSSLTIWFTMVIGQTQRNNMEVSENRGTPKSSIFVWDVPWNKPFFHHPAMGTPISGNLHIIICLVVYLPLWKMMEFVSWGYDIPMEKNGKIKHVPNHQPVKRNLLTNQSAPSKSRLWESGNCVHGLDPGRKVHSCSHSLPQIC
jgi:hypothetical protein